MSPAEECLVVIDGPLIRVSRAEVAGRDPGRGHRLCVANG